MWERYNITLITLKSQIGKYDINLLVMLYEACVKPKEKCTVVVAFWHILIKKYIKHRAMYVAVEFVPAIEKDNNVKFGIPNIYIKTS